MPEILTPEEVKNRFGKMFSERLITLVDEKSEKVRIVEMCVAQGPIEWDAVNRMRAGGAIEKIEVHGNWLIMDAIKGEHDIRFGPVSRDTGGQALRAVNVRDGVVETSWVGLAGASIGVGACLPQAEGVIRTEYENLSELGGNSKVNVKIFTPEMRQLIVGIDDTDSEEKGATWSLGLKLAREIPNAIFMRHKIIQLNLHAPHKTTNCTSTGISLAMPPGEIENAIEFSKKYTRDESCSDQTAIAIWCGIDIPERAVEFGLRAKDTILTIEEAEDAARSSGIKLLEITGSRGKIGALAAIGCFDLGLFSAGLPEDFMHSEGRNHNNRI